jgi:hypothetical protein
MTNETPAAWTVAVTRGGHSGRWYFTATQEGTDRTLRGPTLMGTETADEAATAAKAAIDAFVAQRAENPPPFQYTPAL